MNTMLFALGILACSEKETDTSEETTEDTGEETTEDTGEETTEDTGETEIDVFTHIGTYTDAFGGEQIITEETWTSGSLVFHVSQFNNDENWLIAQNDSEFRSQYCSDWTLYTQEECEGAGETWTDLADKWSRFDIATPADGGMYYCQTAYDAETEDDALAASADATDLAAGCNGFSWSEMREKFNHTGTYEDTYGGSHTISAFTWDSGSLLFHVSQYSNDESWLIAQNDSEKRSQYCSDWTLNTQEECETAEATWTDLADKWSRFDIVDTTDEADGGLFYCQTVFSAEIEDDVLVVFVDVTDMISGCGGFGWIQFITE
jgi:hypothetical protein